MASELFPRAGSPMLKFRLFGSIRRNYWTFSALVCRPQPKCLRPRGSNGKQGSVSRHRKLPSRRTGTVGSRPLPPKTHPRLPKLPLCHRRDPLNPLRLRRVPPRLPGGNCTLAIGAAHCNSLPALNGAGTAAASFTGRDGSEALREASGTPILALDGLRVAGDR